jgi:hypothetical protein
MTVDTIRDRRAANAPEIDQATALEARRQALAQDRARFTQLEPQGEQLLATFTRANFALGVRDLRAALTSRSGQVLDEAIKEWSQQADNFASFGLVAVAAPVPRLHRQEELDTAAAALRTAQAALQVFDSAPYTLEDVTDAREVQGLRLKERARQLEILVNRLQAATAQ